MDPYIVSIRFVPVGKAYHFDASNVRDLKPGDYAVVETSRGWQIGEVVEVIENPTQPDGGWKNVARRATARDMVLRQTWQSKEPEVVSRAKVRAGELKLAGIKIISAEYSYDGARLSIFFTTESEEKVELKSLRQDMQRQYTPSQVELKQIGPRDVSKVMCGMGACGLEKRCCCRFLTEFSSISIRMAKEQGISLTPTEITGMCGRLRCCLIYEYEQYQEMRAQLPKKNKRVMTPQGEGKVVDVQPLRQKVMVEVGELGVREYDKEDVKLIAEPEQPRNEPQPEKKPAEEHRKSNAHEEK
jgi:cell fate regulator YaaT (PSP1 superfamily)